MRKTKPTTNTNSNEVPQNRQSDQIMSGQTFSSSVKQAVLDEELGAQQMVRQYFRDSDQPMMTSHQFKIICQEDELTRATIEKKLEGLPQANICKDLLSGNTTLQPGCTMNMQQMEKRMPNW
jgi:hypothetical protein